MSLHWPASRRCHGRSAGDGLEIDQLLRCVPLGRPKYRLRACGHPVRALVILPSQLGGVGGI